MEEQFDIYDSKGNSIGLEFRSVVHQKGIWHKASNIFVFRSTGKLILQQRQTSKDICPGLWDISAAEHLQPGESFEQGALRGLNEELGIKGVSVEPYGDMARHQLDLPEQGIHDYEFQQSFKTTYDGPIKIDSVEVLTTREVTVNQLKQEMTSNPNDFTSWFQQRVTSLDFWLR